MKPSEVDFEKELDKKQYATEEYITGFHDGMYRMIGFVQREKNKGRKLDEIIEGMYNQAEEYDNR